MRTDAQPLEDHAVQLWGQVVEPEPEAKRSTDR